jgi:hypothetical protein
MADSFSVCLPSAVADGGRARGSARGKAGGPDLDSRELDDFERRRCGDGRGCGIGCWLRIDGGRGIGGRGPVLRQARDERVEEGLVDGTGVGSEAGALVQDPPAEVGGLARSGCGEACAVLVDEVLVGAVRLPQLRLCEPPFGTPAASRRAAAGLHSRLTGRKATPAGGWCQGHW